MKSENSSESTPVPVKVSSELVHGSVLPVSKSPFTTRFVQPEVLELPKKVGNRVELVNVEVISDVAFVEEDSSSLLVGVALLLLSLDVDSVEVMEDVLSVDAVCEVLSLDVDSEELILGVDRVVPLVGDDDDKLVEFIKRGSGFDSEVELVSGGGGSEFGVVDVDSTGEGGMNGVVVD